MEMSLENQDDTAVNDLKAIFSALRRSDLDPTIESFKMLSAEDIRMLRIKAEAPDSNAIIETRFNSEEDAEFLRQYFKQWGCDLPCLACPSNFKRIYSDKDSDTFQFQGKDI